MARRGFEMVDVMKGEHKDIITMDCEPSDVQVIFIAPAGLILIFFSPSGRFFGWSICNQKRKPSIEGFEYGF
jgi:hypothetical protein